MPAMPYIMPSTFTQGRSAGRSWQDAQCEANLLRMTTGTPSERAQKVVFVPACTVVAGPRRAIKPFNNRKYHPVPPVSNHYKSTPVQSSLALAQHDVDFKVQAEKKESGILALLSTRIQRLELERDSAAEQSKSVRQKMVHMQTIFPVLEQENKTIKAENKELKEELLELRKAVCLQQRLINSSEVRFKALEERVNNHMDHTKKEFDEVRKDRLCEEVLEQLKPIAHMAYHQNEIWRGEDGGVEI